MYSAEQHGRGCRGCCFRQGGQEDLLGGGTSRKRGVNLGREVQAEGTTRARVNCLGIRLPPCTSVLSVHLSVGLSEVPGLDGGGTDPMSHALCWSEQVEDGQLQTLISRAMASQGGFHLHPAPACSRHWRFVFTWGESASSRASALFPGNWLLPKRRKWGEQSQ